MFVIGKFYCPCVRAISLVTGLYLCYAYKTFCWVNRTEVLWHRESRASAAFGFIKMYFWSL